VLHEYKAPEKRFQEHEQSVTAMRRKIMKERRQSFSPNIKTRWLVVFIDKIRYAGKDKHNAGAASRKAISAGKSCRGYFSCITSLHPYPLL
jgi:hypothetical protein